MGPRAKLAAAALGVSTAAVPGAGGVDGIPNRALVAYVAAAEQAPCPVPWNVFAAIGYVESKHGAHGGATLGDDGVMRPSAISEASARGPMQFWPPTMEVRGLTNALVDDIDTASIAAGDLLCDNGYATDPTDAIGQYHGGGNWRQYASSRAYVRDVTAKAEEYAKTDPRALPSAQSTPKQRTPDRLWNAVVRGWLRIGTGAHAVGLGGSWGALDDAMFGAETGAPQMLRASSSIADAAEVWAGQSFRPGETEQCAYFVRQVLRDAGVRLSPEVTNETLDGWWTGAGIANSFGGDQGQVIRNVGDLLPGDIVMFANTYGDWPAGSITHVGIYVGDGMMVDRPTAARPVQRRPVSTFSTFVGAVRVR